MVRNENTVCDINFIDEYEFESRIKTVSDNILIWIETEQTFEKKIPGLYKKFDKLVSEFDKVDIIFDIKKISEFRLNPIQRKLCRRFFDVNQNKLRHAYIVTKDQTFLRLTSKLLMRNYFELITFHSSREEALDIINLARI
ncbi:hypothetical protein SAMN04488029_4046 [Reichenbachiella faecimaris]|uniref:SpoIIAA-like n=1 Tax=Reichenbachiella faecimaris TaxID=692418 RepID=A0A1W2GRV4_REIFA|nr:hypothetical protein [Reichenbachiella faecimaris]SMD39108.1 hypothetical protein SAMN04488029_4046 [Reichenbachiella faecimaris]